MLPHALPWRYANVAAENSPLQWKVILWAHLSRGMIDCDWLNCPEKRAIHLVNDMPPGRKWPENLAAFHTVEKTELRSDWEAQRCACLQPLFCLRLPLIHINSLLWHRHMIVYCLECLLDTAHAYTSSWGGVNVNTKFKLTEKLTWCWIK